MINNEIELFICPKCDRTLKSKKALQSHINWHNPNHKGHWPEQATINRTLVIERQKENRRAKYKLNPNTCAECNKPIDFLRRTNKFCCRACSAIFNNLQRIRTGWTDEQKQKNSEKLKNLPKKKRLTGRPRNKSVVSFSNCTVCNNWIVHRSTKPNKKTCSRECKIIACTNTGSWNGKKKLFKYFNKHENKIVTLESSFENEIAIFLDACNLVWVRPKPIIWLSPIDLKTHLYYPDFYLPDFNVYLDPKNDFVISLDEVKLDTVSKKITLYYGGVEYLKSVISELIAQRDNT